MKSIELTTVVGVGASALTAISLLPQLSKIVKDQKAEGVSTVMLTILLAGLVLWIYYGILRDDLIITISNAFALIVNILTVILTIHFKTNLK